MNFQHATHAIREEFNLARKMMGEGFAQQLGMELHAAAQVGRLDCFPIPSSRMMLETLMGTDDDITFGSYLDRKSLIIFACYF